MRLLFVGDVVGNVGRRVVSKMLPAIKKTEEIDFVILNGENSAHGKGITPKIYNTYKNLGVDVITLGNHAYSKNMIVEHLDKLPDLVFPVNMAGSASDKGFILKQCGDLKILVVNIIGQVFMDNVIEKPHVAMAKILNEHNADVVIVDFHGEATAEKRFFFEYFKNHITGVFGTHTHVQTADEMIVDGKAFISDAGMCGAVDSVLGRDVQEVIDKTVFETKTYFTPASGLGMFNGIVVDIDDVTKSCISIKRLNIKEENII